MMFFGDMFGQTLYLFTIDMFELAAIRAFQIKMIGMVAGLDELVFGGIVLLRDLQNHAVFFEGFNKAVNGRQPNLAFKLFINTFGGKICGLVFNQV